MVITVLFITRVMIATAPGVATIAIIDMNVTTVMNAMIIVPPTLTPVMTITDHASRLLHM